MTPSLVLQIVLYLVVGVVFTAFAALVFSSLTLLAGKISPHFEITGPEDWTFREFYVRYLIVAAVFAFVAILLLPLLGCLGLLVGMFALTAAYKRVFDADWPQAVVLGGIGGAIALVLFVFLMVLVLQPLGLVETEPSYELDEESFEEFDVESLEGFDEQSYHPMAPGELRGRCAMLGPACIAPSSRARALPGHATPGRLRLPERGRASDVVRSRAEPGNEVETPRSGLISREAA